LNRWVGGTRETNRKNLVSIAGHSSRPSQVQAGAVCDMPLRHAAAMRVTARGDYAVRAAVELAAADGAARKVSEIADAQEIPPRFLENILLALRRAGLVHSRRGAEGGFRVARPAVEITLADVLRAVEGPLANVQGVPPDAVAYEGSAAPLRDVWVAVRASLRVVLEHAASRRLRARQPLASVRSTTAMPPASRRALSVAFASSATGV